jgi:hypothetical protein
MKPLILWTKHVKGIRDRRTYVKISHRGIEPWQWSTWINLNLKTNTTWVISLYCVFVFMKINKTSGFYLGIPWRICQPRWKVQWVNYSFMLSQVDHLPWILSGRFCKTKQFWGDPVLKWGPEAIFPRCLIIIGACIAVLCNNSLVFQKDGWYHSLTLFFDDAGRIPITKYLLVFPSAKDCDHIAMEDWCGYNGEPVKRDGLFQGSGLSLDLFHGTGCQGHCLANSLDSACASGGW